MTIYAKDMLDVQVHFSTSLSVIFIRVSPSVSRKVSKELGLIKKDLAPYWDTLSNEESEERLILLPEQPLDTEKTASFALCGTYKEISLAEAENMLANASKTFPLNRTSADGNPFIVELLIMSFQHSETLLICFLLTLSNFSFFPVQIPHDLIPSGSSKVSAD